MIYVVDASVVLKWFVTEHDSETALRLQTAQMAGPVELVAPDLLLYEIAHVLLRKKQFGPAETQEAVRAVLGGAIDLVVPDEELMVRALQVAHALCLSVYDACYAALAGQIGAALVTGDRAHLAVRKFGVDVQLLEELKLQEPQK